MGSCFSKDATVQSQASHSGRTEKKPQSSGHQLGDASALTQKSKEAAARAAELRYAEHQEKIKTSTDKLKAMEKISKKDKGLA